jgi:transposase
LRSLNRYRDFLLGEHVAAKNRKDDFNESRMVRQLSKRRCTQLGADIKKVEKKMREVIQQSERLKKDYELLVTIPGVSFVTACTILAEMGELRRFGRARQLTAFAGVSPRNYESGTSVRGGTHLCKSGSPRVRQALYMASLTAARMAGPLKDDYNRLVNAGKERMVALGAVMRKLLVLMRAILISDRPYDKNHQRSGKPCGKLAA